VSGSLLLPVAIVVLLAAVIALVIAVVVLLRARRVAAGSPGGRSSGGSTGTAGPADPFRTADADHDALRGDPRTLKPGDLVEIRSHTYAVRGTLRFKEGGWHWAEHLLDDANGDKVWISVEEDPDLQLALWREVRAATITPGEKTIDFDGLRFSSDESGRATYQSVGTTGLDPQGTMRYHDYTSRDGALLSFERYGDSETWEVGRGDPLHRHEVQIFPQATP
jgi:hypothetical protein